jgi:hypothetical protein
MHWCMSCMRKGAGNPRNTIEHDGPPPPSVRQGTRGNNCGIDIETRDQPGGHLFARETRGSWSRNTTGTEDAREQTPPFSREYSPAPRTRASEIACRNPCWWSKSPCQASPIGWRSGYLRQTRNASNRGGLASCLKIHSVYQTLPLYRPSSPFRDRLGRHGQGASRIVLQREQDIQAREGTVWREQDA